MARMDSPSPSAGLPFTGERFVPGARGEIWVEHWHRYHFAAQFARGLRVVDAACGEGYGSALLARHAASVVGADLSPGGLHGEHLADIGVIHVPHAGERLDLDPVHLAVGQPDIVAVGENPVAAELILQIFFLDMGCWFLGRILGRISSDDSSLNRVQTNDLRFPFYQHSAGFETDILESNFIIPVQFQKNPVGGADILPVKRHDPFGS